MVVRLVKEHRRAGIRFPAGELLEVRGDEAMSLVRDGIAVPCTEDLACETRTA